MYGCNMPLKKRFMSYLLLEKDIVYTYYDKKSNYNDSGFLENDLKRFHYYHNIFWSEEYDIGYNKRFLLNTTVLSLNNFEFTALLYN